MLRKEPVEREGWRDEQGLPSPNRPHTLERSGRTPSPGRRKGPGRSVLETSEDRSWSLDRLS